MEDDNVINTLRCMILLEEAAADFYERLSRVVRIVECSAALAFVARESANHAMLLRSLYGDLPSETCCSGTTESKAPRKMRDEILELLKCHVKLGEAGAAALRRLRELTDRLDSGWTPSHRQVAELLEEVNDVERFAGEEVYGQVAAAVLSTRFTKLERELLLSIAEEERRHYDIIRVVAEELKRL